MTRLESGAILRRFRDRRPRQESQAMRTSRWLALLTLVLFAGALGTAQLATARGEIRWKLKVEPALDAVRNPVGRLAVKPEKGGEQVYWYVVYTVTNRGPD